MRASTNLRHLGDIASQAGVLSNPQPSECPREGHRVGRSTFALGHKADVTAPLMNVLFRSKNRHQKFAALPAFTEKERRLRAAKGSTQTNSPPLIVPCLSALGCA